MILSKSELLNLLGLAEFAGALLFLLAYIRPIFISASPKNERKK
jgi:hypothetical protein